VKVHMVVSIDLRKLEGRLLCIRRFVDEIALFSG
jgi:hypothetical protein